MTNFVLLYTGGGMPESEEESAAVMAAWGAWYGRLGEAVVDGGNPFGPARVCSGLGGESGENIVSPPVTGYTIIAADSIDDAVAQVQDHPHLKYGGQVSVYETFQM